MIVVTGGAGFIGSALIWALNGRGEDDILVVDQLRQTEKWKNLVGLRFADYMDKEVFIERIQVTNHISRSNTIFQAMLNSPVGCNYQIVGLQREWLV